MWSASSGVFFSVRLQSRILLLRLVAHRLLGLLRPIGQDVISQLADLFNGASFGFMRSAAFGYGLIVIFAMSSNRRRKRGRLAKRSSKLCCSVF